MAEETALPAPEIQEFGPSIYYVDGPDVNFFGFPYPTRMVLIKLDDGSVWMWSPIHYTVELGEKMKELGLTNIKHVVSPNMIHHLSIKEWQDMFPEAAYYAPPGLKKRKVAKDIRFDHDLENNKETEFEGEIKHQVFDASAMQEVEFYHVKSKTAIFGDLIQRFPEEKATGFKGWLMKADGLVGKNGSAPREWRLTFMFGKKKARAAKSVVVDEWKPENLIIAHGDCVKDGTATSVIQKALKWM